MERIEQDRREAQDDEAEELRAEEQAIARAEAEKQQRGKSGTRMEHCSYRHSDFYWLFSLLMHCMESQLSNQRPNQCILKKVK